MRNFIGHLWTLFWGFFPGFLRFASSGLVAALFEMGCFSLLYYKILPLCSEDFPRLLWANIIGRILSNILNYLTNKYLVFKDTSRCTGRSMLVYLILSVLLLGCSYGLQWTVHTLFPGNNAALIKFCVDGCLCVGNFFAQRRWCFGKGPVPEN